MDKEKNVKVIFSSENGLNENITPNGTMTKEELRKFLYEGQQIENLFHFENGQECMIFKYNWELADIDDIVYIKEIPDEIYLDSGLCLLEKIIDCTYTKKEFIEICHGHNKMAKTLLEFVSWESPNLDQMRETYYEEEWDMEFGGGRMTEQKAIEIINEEKSWESDDRKIDAFIMAVNALGEIQKYRELEQKLNGVDLTMLVNSFIEHAAEGEIQGYQRGRILTNGDADKWDAYLAIGTPEECRAAVEEQKDIKRNAIDSFAKWLESKKYLMKEIQERDFCYTHYDELNANCVTTEYLAEQLKSGDGE